MSCLFCEIVAGSIPAKMAYEDDDVLAFHDINPQAPDPRPGDPQAAHHEPRSTWRPATTRWWAAWCAGPRDLARETGLAERGFRLVFNCGDDAGYSVYHIHLHLVGGRELGWPPG